jgi:sulfotransferase
LFGEEFVPQNPKRIVDQRLGTPGLHDVGSSVRTRQGRPILPPDLFKRNEADAF